MAFDRSDIEKIRDSVPANFRAEGAGGVLTNNFLSVGALRAPTPLKGSEQNNIAELTKFNLGMGFLDSGADNAAPNFILGGSQAAMVAKIEQADKHQKENDLDWALKRSRELLEARLAELDAELAAIDKRMDEITARRGEIGESMSTLQDIDDLIASGKFDPNDPAQAALCKRAGINPDDMHDKDDWADIIARRRDELSREDAILDTEWNDLLKRRGVVVAEKHKVRGALDDIENADTDEARILAERRAQTTLGAQQLAEAATWTNSTDAKLVAANAVAVSAKSEAFNQDAISGNAEAIVTGSANSFDMDDAPKQWPSQKPLVTTPS